MLDRKYLLNIEATSHCPARCSMCPRWQVDKFGYLEPATLERILSQASKDRIWEIDLAGRGEPTTHPQFPLLAEMLGGSGIPTAVVTTGVALNDKVLDACARHLDRIRLSVSASDEDVFGQIHVGLSHARVWKNIVRLADVAADKTIIHLTGGPAIYESLPKTVGRLRRLGFKDLRLLPLWNRGGELASQIDNKRRLELMESLNLNPFEDSYLGMGKTAFLLRMVAMKLSNLRYCPVGESSLGITYEGVILGCFQDFGCNAPQGSVFTTTLEEAYQARSRHLGRMPVCAGCDAHQVAMTGKNLWGDSGKREPIDPTLNILRTLAD